MKLNHKNKQIVEYLKLKNKYFFADKYLQFLNTGKKFSNQHLKILLSDISSNDFLEFEKNILEIFSLYKIDVNKKLPSSTSARVKKHREDIKAKGYKNISLQLPPDIYQNLKTLKLKKQMTYSQLISFLVSTQK